MFENRHSEMINEAQIENIKKALEETTNKKILAENFIKIQPLYYDKGKNWWLWDFNEFRWVLVDETDILNTLGELSKVDTINSRSKLEILEALRQISRKNKPKDIVPYWIQLKDKIYDIKTGEIFNATPEYFVTNPIPWKKGEYDVCPIFDKLFVEWVGEENKQILYEILAYCLLPDYPINRLFCFVGAGLNGKSKFMELLINFVGKSNITSTELDTLLGSRFEVTRLHKKLACIMGETNFNEIKNTSMLKKLTGNDLVGFEYKNKNPFEDKSYAKILISTNNLPPTNDKTIGFYRRWDIIDFPNKFNEKKDVLKDIPDDEYENLANKCLDVLKELLIKREFHNEGTIEERAKRFEDRSNPLDKFIKENTEDDPDGNIPKFEFKQRLDDWTVEHNMRKLTDTTIGKKMKEMGYEVFKITAEWFTKEGERPRIYVWGGLKWKNNTGVRSVQAIPTHLHTRKPSSILEDTLDTLTISEEKVE